MCWHCAIMIKYTAFTAAIKRGSDMKRICKLALASSLLLVISNNVFADVSKDTGYKNQRGSSMDLIWNADGTLTGTFTTAVSQCKAALGKAAPVTGVYNGNAVALTVNYPECDSVLAMSGNVKKNRNEMNLHWFLTRQGEGSLQEWNTTTTGEDQYKN